MESKVHNLQPQKNLRNANRIEILTNRTFVKIKIEREREREREKERTLQKNYGSYVIPHTTIQHKFRGRSKLLFLTTHNRQTGPKIIKFQSKNIRSFRRTHKLWEGSAS